MNYDNLHQSFLETIADWLDSETVILALTLNDLRDPEPREQSELHIRMAAAAIEEMKKTLIQTNFRRALPAALGDNTKRGGNTHVMPTQEKTNHARPILFSAPMVRAILDGRKTQTRRIIKPQPRQIKGGWEYGKKYKNSAFGVATPATDVLYKYECPYGQPGDVLWVKEYFWRNRNDHNDIIFEKPEPKYKAYWQGIAGRFMPRSAARILLQITDIRCERLQDITEADAVAEGCTGGGDWHTAPTVHYSKIRKKINSPHSWEQNPWVWVIQFDKIPAALGVVTKRKPRREARLKPLTPPCAR